MPINLFYELKKYEDISYAAPSRVEWSASPSPPTDRRPCGACVDLPNPTFWQRNLSSLKWEYAPQSAGIRRFYRRR